MSTFEYIILFLTIVGSGLVYFSFKKIEGNYLKLILSFTGSFLFGLIVLDLMPSVFEHLQNRAGMFLLLGFFLQVMLDFFSEGIEHGHIHVHTHKTFPVGMMIGLCLHSFIEAIPLSQSNNTHQHLFWGIMLHHIPVAFALMAMLMQSQVSKQHAIISLIAFAGMSPLGAFVGFVLQSSSVNNLHNYFDYVMATVIGILLHISTTILFESNNDHRFNFKKLVIVAAGAGIALLLHL
jgi:zinc transporter ZupT